MKILTLLLGLLSCQPSNLNVDNSGNVEVQEEPSPITWVDCSGQEGDHPCDFTLKDQDGNNFNLYELYGKPIIVDFSTMWCYYCQRAAYDIKEISDLYSEEELVYITILIQDFSGEPPDQDDLLDWQNHFEITGKNTPVLAADQNMLSASPADGWYIEAYPTFYFISTEMEIKMYLRGFSEAAVNAGIDTIIHSDVIDQ